MEALDDELTRTAASYDKVTHIFAEREDWKTTPPKASKEGSSFRDVNNSITRAVVEEALAGRRLQFIVDAACGKGGGIPKYFRFLVDGAEALLVDISEASVREAKARATTSHWQRVSWKFEVADCFAPTYWRKLPPDSVDAVVCNFSLHYAFADPRRAEKMLAAMVTTLQPGGVFVGTIVDSEAVLAEIRQGDKSGLFNIKDFRGPPQLGADYLFDLPGHVESTREYLVPCADLCRLGMKAGLVPVEGKKLWHNFGTLSESKRCDEETRRLCRLYTSFAFRKPDIGEAGPAVAVYTGSFDPVHSNHLQLCRHVLEQEDIQHVYICPNTCSPFKTHTASIEHRVQMVNLALGEAGLTERCSVYPLGKANWAGRLEMCEQVGRRNPRSKAFILVGQDSMQSSLERAAARGAGGVSEVASSGHQILVCPRLDCEPLRVPEKLRGAVRVLDYVDPAQISSTEVRESLAGSRADLQGVLARAVELYIREQRLYEPASERRFAWDGSAYTLAEFCEYFGEDSGVVQWEAAFPESVGKPRTVKKGNRSWGSGKVK